MGSGVLRKYRLSRFSLKSREIEDTIFPVILWNIRLCIINKVEVDICNYRPWSSRMDFHLLATFHITFDDLKSRSSKDNGCRLEISRTAPCNLKWDSLEFWTTPYRFRSPVTRSQIPRKWIADSTCVWIPDFSLSRRSGFNKRNSLPGTCLRFSLPNCVCWCKKVTSCDRLTLPSSFVANVISSCRVSWSAVFFCTR